MPRPRQEKQFISKDDWIEQLAALLDTAVNAHDEAYRASLALQEFNQWNGITDQEPRQSPGLLHYPLLSAIEASGKAMVHYGDLQRLIKFFEEGRG